MLHHHHHHFCCFISSRMERLSLRLGDASVHHPSIFARLCCFSPFFSLFSSHPPSTFNDETREVKEKLGKEEDPGTSTTNNDADNQRKISSAGGTATKGMNTLFIFSPCFFTHLIFIFFRNKKSATSTLVATRSRQFPCSCHDSNHFWVNFRESFCFFYRIIFLFPFLNFWTSHIITVFINLLFS